MASGKLRYNEKSRANLVQYRKRESVREADTEPILDAPTPEFPSRSGSRNMFARQIVDDIAPEAAAYLASVVRGQGSARRAPVKTRVDAAVRILEMAGLKSDVAGCVPMDDLNTAELAAFIAAGSRALALQAAQRVAEDATVVSPDAN